MTDLSPLHNDVAKLIARCKQDSLRVATAESCTGGLVAGAITELDGASAVFDWGVVTYSNAAKTEMLGVSESLINEHGAVSEQVVMAMAEGALAKSGADIAIAVTGIAGPTGGTDEKPVGLIHFATAAKGKSTQRAAHRFADLGRDSTRFYAVQQAIKMLMQQVAT